MKLGEKIFALRKQKGLTQERLADMLYVSRQAVSKWEVGESSPSVDNLVDLSEIFGVSVDYMLKGEREVLVVSESEEEYPQAIPLPSADIVERRPGTIIAIMDGFFGTFPLTVTFIYFLFGFGFGWWHPNWLIFLLMPIVMEMYDKWRKR